MNTDSIDPTPEITADYAARIKAERQKRAWTQERLAEASGLSTRTVQRLECGEAPSAETLKMLAAAFGIGVEEMGRDTGKTIFKSPYFTQKWRYAMLAYSAIILLLCIALIVKSFAHLPLWGMILLPLQYLVIFSNVVFFYTTGLSVRDGKLLIHHRGWAKKYDLSRLTGIEICPEALGAFPLTSPLCWNYSAPWYAASLGIFVGYQTNADTCVILEFGKKKIVVSPDDHDAFVEAIQRAIDNITPADTPEGGKTNAGWSLLQYSARIRAERRKRAWTQDKLAAVSCLSVRTIQRLECGAAPSTETLRLLAEAFEIDAATFISAAKSPKTRFRATYSWSFKVTFTILAVTFIVIPFVAVILEKTAGISYHHAMIVYGALFLLYMINLFSTVNSFTIKGGRLVVQHFLLASRYDLSKLTNIEINPDAMMGAIPLSYPFIVPSAWYRSALLETFRAHLTDPAHSVVMEFGSKKIVVTPDDPQAYFEAVREELKTMENTDTAKRGTNP